MHRSSVALLACAALAAHFAPSRETVRHERALRARSGSGFIRLTALSRGQRKGVWAGDGVPSRIAVKVRKPRRR